jgi:3-deoxy-7-phosphoheptulonate synthase
MARAGLAAGASGLLIEVHTAPDTAYSDGAQTISVEDFEGIGRDAELIAGLEDL